MGESSLFVVHLRDRARLLRSRAVVVPLLELLKQVLADRDCACEAFCFITNELRVVVSSTNDDVRVRAAFVAFKDSTERWFRDSGFPGWDDRFFARPLRTTEERQAAIYEVLSAPILSGSGETIRQYPFVGSLTSSVEG